MYAPSAHSLEVPYCLKKWRGLGAWNFYFFLKFALLAYGYLNFHPFLNLVFLTALLLPMPSSFWHRVRNWIALPIGLALFYHDTWLPGIRSIISEGHNVWGFSFDYILELMHRFINWNMIAAALILWVLYLFASQWLRLTTLTIFILLWINIKILPLPNILKPKVGATAIVHQQTTIASAQKESAATASPSNETATDDQLNHYLQDFYKTESTRLTQFPNILPADAVPFDLLIIQICSLAWKDMEAVHLENHPLWKRLNILFKNFDSAASYSNPAALRLLRASCGQPRHTALYQDAQPPCYLLENLAKLGFTSKFMMDHSGVYGNMLIELQKYGGLQNIPLMSNSNISPALTSFAGSPIYSNSQILNRWLEQIKQPHETRSATYFNIISLHDGNRSLEGKPVSYEAVATLLFNDIDTFLQKLEASGRKAIVVVIPEHGRNLMGDALQMPGLRDIPTPDITHIPVGIKLVGMQTSGTTQPQWLIQAPSSYLALSELLARMVDGKIFNQPYNTLQALISNLPITAPVAENAGSTVMSYQGKYYVELAGESWSPMP